MSNDLEFKDTLSYEAPESPDCLMVPEEQWNEIHSNLNNTHPFKDNLLWVLIGICGGGSISCWVTYVTFPESISHSIKLTFLMLGILLPIAAVVILLVVMKIGSETTAQNVSDQMSVLKKGFRKLTSSNTGE